MSSKELKVGTDNEKTTVVASGEHLKKKLFCPLQINYMPDILKIEF